MPGGPACSGGRRPGPGRRDRAAGPSGHCRCGAPRHPGRQSCWLSRPAARSHGRWSRSVPRARAIAAGRTAPVSPFGHSRHRRAGAGAPPHAPASWATGSSELRREQAETAALVESMVEGVIAADERGRIVTRIRPPAACWGTSEADALPGLPELFRVKAAREVVDAVLQGRGGAGSRARDGRRRALDERPAAAGRRRRAGDARCD